MQGVPSRLENSTGAAPVPPSEPSMVMKSGRIFVSSIALMMAMNSTFLPRHSLKPTGLPPLSVLRRATKKSSPLGVSNSGCMAGEFTVLPTSTRRILAISSVTLAPGSTPPWEGFAPCESFISIILTTSRFARSAKASSLNEPSGFRQPKYPVPICQMMSPPWAR